VCVRRLCPQGFARIENLDEYTGLKSIFLEGNGLESLDGLQARTAAPRTRTHALMHMQRQRGCSGDGAGAHAVVLDAQRSALAAALPARRAAREKPQRCAQHTAARSLSATRSTLTRKSPFFLVVRCTHTRAAAAAAQPCVELRCVFAQQNCLTRIAHLSHLTKLDTLNLSSNRLTSLDGIQALTSLTSLQARTRGGSMCTQLC
jgi:Leucine-rich repeat (LRR) protein